MKVKLKTLTLAKAADVDGEHRVKFVASDASVDRQGEIVEISTFRLPKKGGGEIVAAAIPESGTDEVDVPLLTDHDMWSVDKVIGSVRRAYMEEGQLIFEAGISSRDYAQDVYKLISEGHLDNAFSISFSDYDYHDGVITNGEILEVSLVTRGANKDARVLEAKSVAGADEAGDTEEPAADEGDSQEAAETKSESEEAPAETEDENKTEPAADEGDEPEQSEEEAQEESNDNPEEDNMRIDEKAKNIAKTQVMDAPEQKVVSTNENYLKSKQAMVDFTRVLVESKGKGAGVANQKWAEFLKTKGISGDAILPSQIEQVFFKTWDDNDSLLQTFRHVNVNAAAAYAMTGNGEGIRAKGHRKGDKKADQDLKTLRRDLKYILVYKKLTIDLQDLLDDESGELTRFRTEELAKRVRNEIVVGAIIGDGRTAPASDEDPDYRVFDGTRGLWPMAADITNSTTAGSYAAAVASIVERVETDNNYDKAIKTIAALNRVEGDRVVLITKRGFKRDLRLAKGTDGHYIFTPASNLEEAIDARIVELPEMADAAYDMIAYIEGQYMLIGKNEMSFVSFDLENNKDKMLLERPAGGSLFGSKVAAGYPATTES